MDSLDDILNRVLQSSTEKVVQRIQPAMNRRPLKDPQTNAVGFFQDIQSAVRNIRSPEVAGALQSQAMQGSARYATPEEMEDFNNGGMGLSSPADRSRRTTIGDDANVLGEMANSAAQIVRQVVTAGKAIGQFTGNAGKLDRAVSGMAQTVVAADKDVKASKPTEGFMGWLKSLMGKTGTVVGDSSSGSGTATAGSGGVASWLESSSIADSVRGLFGRFNPLSTQATGKTAAGGGSVGSASVSQQNSGSGDGSANDGDNKKQSWLESSSIADSVRGFFGRFRVSPAQMVGMNPAASGGSVPLAQQDPGSGETFVSRISQSFDRALAKSSAMFRQMNRQSRVASGNDDEDKKESWLDSSSIADSVRGFTRKTVSRLGRKALNSKALRQRVANGQRLIRGRVRVMPAGGGGGGAGGGAAGAGGGGGFGARIGGMFGGMFGGGGGGAAAAGGGGAGGAAAGGAMAGGAAIAGLAVVFVAIAAAAAAVVAALYKLGMAGYETALRVAQFDGQLAAAKSQLDVSRMMRDIGTARTLSEAGSGFMKSLDKLEQALRPLTDGAMEVGLNAMIVIVDFVTWAFKGLLQATNSLIKGFDMVETALGMDLINAAMLQRLDNIANGQQAGGPINVGQRGFFDGQMRDRPFRQPRPQLPPMGGGNGN